MSNINAQNIIVTNLTVTNINGKPASSIYCNYDPCGQTDDCYDCPDENNDCPECFELQPLPPAGPTGPTGPAGPAGYGNGAGITYANDTWLLDNLLGQPPPITFGTPVYKTTEILIPWNYSQQLKWTSTQYLPNIQSFTQTINPFNDLNETYVVADPSDAHWIKDNTDSSHKYATILSIQKNNTESGFDDITYIDDSGNNITNYGYKYYESDLINSLGATGNQIKAYYSNESEIGTINEQTLIFGGFLLAGNPGKPTGLNLNSDEASGLSISFTEPVADTVNPGQGKIKSYYIDYTANNNSIRYGGLISQTGNATSNINTVSLNGLHPDTEYSIKIKATNDSEKEGEYSDNTFFTTSFLQPLSPLSSVSFTGTTYNLDNSATGVTGATGATGSTGVTGSTGEKGVGNIYTVSGQSIGSTPLLKNSSIETDITVPIHLIGNRGSAYQDLMTFSTKINTNNECSVSFSGFPGTTPSAITSNNITITPTDVVDNYSDSDNYNQGFYLNAPLNIQVLPNTFISGNSLNTVTCEQTFSDNLIPPASAYYNFYYETPFTDLPTGSISKVDIAISYFKYISGICVLWDGPEITINAIADNMGDYFYISPPISYTTTFSSVSTTFSETNLTNASASVFNERIKDNTLSFQSTITSDSLSSVFAKTFEVTANMNNINGSFNTSQSTNAITDGQSCTFVYQTLGQSIKTLDLSDTIGHRIWSAPTVINNCPDLKFVDIEFFEIPYNNSWDISSDNNDGYDATTELQVIKGEFITKAFNQNDAYIDYSSYLYNTYNYSTIEMNETRFASFCWKIPEKTSSYNLLYFTINSGVSQFKNNHGGSIQVNDTDLLMFYAIRDASTDNYDDKNINTVWINANSNENIVTSRNYFLNENTAILGGLYNIISPGVGIYSNSITIEVFVPAVKTSSSTYLYFRIGCLMSTSFSFNNVSSSIQ